MAIKPKVELVGADADQAEIDDVQVLRAGAILMVVSFHTRILQPYMLEFFGYGFTGVNLFFKG